jgi:hypothetical protein
LTITVCTSQFDSLVKATARSNGFPNIPIISVPHPIGGIEVDEIRKKADVAFEEIVKILRVKRN